VPPFLITPVGKKVEQQELNLYSVICQTQVLLLSLTMAMKYRLADMMIMNQEQEIQLNIEMKNSEECETDCECHEEEFSIPLTPVIQVENPMSIPYIPSDHVNALKAKRERLKKRLKKT
jgi:hypothetical protein